MRRFAVSLAALGAVVTISAATPAAAVDGVPTMRIWVEGADTGTLSICARGTSDSVARLWVLTVTGTRDGGEPIAERRESSSGSFEDCLHIPKMTSSGALTGTFDHAGAGLDVAGAFPAYGVWRPGHRDITGGSGATL